jgi:hypothetical protein
LREVLRIERHRPDLGGTADHVLVREHVTGGVDEEPRAQALSGEVDREGRQERQKLHPVGRRRLDVDADHRALALLGDLPKALRGQRHIAHRVGGGHQDISGLATAERLGTGVQDDGFIGRHGARRRRDRAADYGKGEGYGHEQGAGQNEVAGERHGHSFV